jgi:DNA-3-methyladenine glycosylase
VYLNYGIHSLVNAVTEQEGSPAAILIRALEPLEGLAAMRRRRLAVRSAGLQPGVIRDHDLCRGPGNLTVALGIGLRHNRADLTRGPLAVEDHGIRRRDLEWSPRIGIRVGVDRRWRCYVRDSSAVSGRRSFTDGSASLRSAP